MRLKEVRPGFSACKSSQSYCKYRIRMQRRYGYKADDVYSQWEEEGNGCCCAESS